MGGQAARAPSGQGRPGGVKGGVLRGVGRGEAPGYQSTVGERRGWDINGGALM